MIPSFDAVLFWNTVFDKGAMAAVIVAVGYLANRYLEQYRSEKALATEAAKTRLARIGELWEELNVWEADAKRLFIEFCHRVVEELRAANFAGLAAEEDSASESSLEVLIGLGNVALPPVVVERVTAFSKPQHDALAVRGNELWRKIARYRFWLTDEVYTSMLRYHQQMQEAAVELNVTRDGFERSRSAFAALDAARQNVEDTMQRLITGSRARVPRQTS
jgi:hypothetical protein